MPATTKNENAAALQVHKHSTKGRCFLATRGISKGELVLRAKPYSFIPDCNNLDKFCYKCLAQIQQQIHSCSACSFVNYCSIECLELDCNLHKPFECQFFSTAWPSLSTFSGYTLDYLRLLIRVVLRKILHEDKVSLHGIDDGLLFENVWDLCANMDGFPDDRIAEFKSIANILTGFIQNIPSGPKHFSFDTLLQLICKEECNSFGLYFGDTRQGYGLALYPTAVYFNHSCIPNIVHSTSGVDEVFHAARDIKAGEELCISYISLTEPVLERRRELKQLFLFDCDCPRCISEEKCAKETELIAISI